MFNYSEKDGDTNVINPSTYSKAMPDILFDRLNRRRKIPYKAVDILIEV